jgi:hypothetical protein
LSALDKLCKHLGLYAGKGRGDSGGDAWAEFAGLLPGKGELTYDQLVRLHRETLGLPPEAAEERPCA